MKIEVHMLQNRMPGSVNRNDNGECKSCNLGGYRRARISSQCMKRAIRRSGIRSRSFPQQVCDRLIQLGMPEKDALKYSKQFSKTVGRSKETVKEEEEKNEKSGKKTKDDSDLEMNQAIFYQKEEVDNVGDQLYLSYKDGVDEKDAVEKLKKIEVNKIDPDIAKYGRMITDRHFEEIDSSTQFSHAISTHEANNQQDYFTLVDDLNPKGGASLIDSSSFNSSCVYRYNNIDVEQLLKNLRGDKESCQEAIEQYLKDSILMQLKGKQNSFADFTLPYFILITVVKENSCINLGDAFYNPVEAKNANKNSVNALSAHWKAIKQVYDKDFFPLLNRAFCVGTVLPDEKNEDWNYCSNLESLIKLVMNEVN